MLPSLNHPTKLAALCLFILFPITLSAGFILIFLNKTIIIDWTILSINSTSIIMSFILDPTGLIFSSLVILISACVINFSTRYISSDPLIPRFIWLVILFVVSINFLIFIPNLIAILLGWDGLGLVSFLLVIYYQNHKSLAAGMLTILANRVGDVIILLSIAWALTQGHWNVLFFWETPLSQAIALAIMVAGITKRAQIPFSRWLPAAMAAPTPVSALVHSSTLVTAGVFLLIRFFPFLSSINFFCPTLLVISCATIFIAGISAIFETDLKKIIALSTLSQLGVIMAAIGLDLLYLALFHLFTHALFKALLFLCAGNIIHQSNNNQDLRLMGGLWSQLPLSVACLNTANFALIGTPFLAGFYSKDAILELAASGPCNLMISVMLVLATLLTAAYSFRLSVISLWGPVTGGAIHSISDDDSFITYPIIILTSGAIAGGAAIGWVFLPSILEPSLPLSLKTLPLVLTILGALIALSSSQMMASPIMAHKSSHFSSRTIWFLGLVSTQVSIAAPLKVGHSTLKSLDHGWWEMFAGQGIFFTLKKSFQTAQPIQASLLTNLIGIVIFLLSAIFLIYSLYLGSLYKAKHWRCLESSAILLSI